jgi:hypothetical protein
VPTARSARDRAVDAAIAFALELAQGPPECDEEQLGRLDHRAACTKLAQLCGRQPRVLEDARDDPRLDPVARTLLANAWIWTVWSTSD